MAKNHHKPVLFDSILAPSKEQVQRKKAIRKNRSRFLLDNGLRIILTILGTIVGSLVFTIVINALIQERSVSDVAIEFWSKIERLWVIQ